jgi:glycolate oxidase FAD binding subunit
MTQTPEDKLENGCEHATQRSFLLDGREPDRVYCPRSETEAVDAVREAAAHRMAIVPWGGGTAIRTGQLLAAGRWAVIDSSKLDTVLEYSPDDMVVTAAAGAPLAEVQALLRSHNQFLPIDPPFADRATMGGVTATNAFGLYRATFGLARDRLLGAKMVLSNGDLVKAGGKVVKNVAGYDLGKLVAGSWGTLGLITETTYKTNPIPAAHRLLSFVGADMPQLVEAALQVRANRLEPLFLFASGPSHPQLLVGLMGSAEAVEWQASEISDLLEKFGLTLLTESASADQQEEAARSLVVRSEELVKLRISARPSDMSELLTMLLPLCDRIGCHIASGVIEAALTEESFRRAEANGAASWTQFLCESLPIGANLVWTSLPAAWKAEVDVWGSSRGNSALMRGIKAAFDPDRIFNPGRFIDRI